MRYALVTEKAESNYSAYVPDPPGRVATGVKVEEVEREIKTLRFHLDGPALGWRANSPTINGLRIRGAVMTLASAVAHGSSGRNDVDLPFAFVQYGIVEADPNASFRHPLSNLLPIGVRNAASEDNSGQEFWRKRTIRLADVLINYSPFAFVGPVSDFVRSAAWTFSSSVPLGTNVGRLPEYTMG
jgi:hypothetical protein